MGLSLPTELPCRLKFLQGVVSPKSATKGTQSLHSYKRKCKQYKKMINLLLHECVLTIKAQNGFRLNDPSTPLLQN